MGDDGNQTRAEQLLKDLGGIAEDNQVGEFYQQITATVDGEARRVNH